MENNILKKYTIWLLRILLYWSIIYLLIIIVDLNISNNKLDEKLRNFSNFFSRSAKGIPWMIE
jgi:hypothetical protein